MTFFFFCTNNVNIQSYGQKFTYIVKNMTVLRFNNFYSSYLSVMSGTHTTHIKKKKKEKKEHSWIFGWNHPQASGSPLAEFLTIQNWWNQATIVALLARTSSAQSRCSCWGSNQDFVRPFQNLKPVLAWFNHSFTTFEVCLGLLSCWNTQLYPRPNLLADGFRFS